MNWVASLWFLSALVLGGCDGNNEPQIPEDGWDGGSDSSSESQTEKDGDGGILTDGDGALPPCKVVPPSGTHPWDSLYQGMQAKQGTALRQALLGVIDSHHSLGYDTAKTQIFTQIDKVGGKVQCVYTGDWIAVSGVPSIDLMNVEHSWPQSLGADKEPARSDLHHLFAARSEVNSRRSNLPFGDVINATWSQGGSLIGGDDGYRSVFEPRDPQKGNTARAMFYFSVRYQMQIPQFEETALRYWNCVDPPDDDESQRNSAIEDLQNNRNPFVDHPEYVERITDF